MQIGCLAKAGSGFTVASSGRGGLFYKELHPQDLITSHGRHLLISTYEFEGVGHTTFSLQQTSAYLFTIPSITHAC